MNVEFLVDPPFNIGDRVLCVQANPTQTLVEGEVYTVGGVWSRFLEIRDEGVKEFTWYMQVIEHLDKAGNGFQGYKAEYFAQTKNTKEIISSLQKTRKAMM